MRGDRGRVEPRVLDGNPRLVRQAQSQPQRVVVEAVAPLPVHVERPQDARAHPDRDAHQRPGLLALYARSVLREEPGVPGRVGRDDRLAGRGHAPAEGLPDGDALTQHRFEGARGRLDADEELALHEAKARLAPEHRGRRLRDRAQHRGQIQAARQPPGDLHQRGQTPTPVLRLLVEPGVPQEDADLLADRLENAQLHVVEAATALPPDEVEGPGHLAVGDQRDAGARLVAREPADRGGVELRVARHVVRPHDPALIEHGPAEGLLLQGDPRRRQSLEERLRHVVRGHRTELGPLAVGQVRGDRVGTRHPRQLPANEPERLLEVGRAADDAGDPEEPDVRRVLRRELGRPLGHEPLDVGGAAPGSPHIDRDQACQRQAGRQDAPRLPAEPEALALPAASQDEESAAECQTGTEREEERQGKPDGEWQAHRGLSRCRV